MKTSNSLENEHTNHLNNMSMVHDTDRAISQAISYIPYGEVFVEQQSGGWSSPYLFNAKELDSETGLYYYGARYLDPSDAMWLSVDPLWEKYVGMTPYQYCMGNPVKLVDVDGNSTFNIVDETDVTETIDDGIDQTVDMYREDFSILKEAFDTDDSEDKTKYNSYFDALTTRPSFEDMAENYPQGSIDEVFESIGGKVAYNRKTNPKEFSNSCAVRLSKSLNYSGKKILRKWNLQVGSGADKNWYFYKVKELSKYITYSFGEPEFIGTYEELQNSGLKGIIQFSDCGWSDASGHFDLFNGDCVNHCYGDRCKNVKLWILPR